MTWVRMNATGPSGERGPGWVQLSVVKACSIEIWAQFGLLFLVLFPLCALIYPALLLSFGVWAFVHTLANVHPGLGWLSASAEAAFVPVAFAAGTLILGLGMAHLIQLALLPKADRGRRLKELRGASGAKLLSVVSDLWSTLPGHRRPPPQVLWFSNVNLIASAVTDGRGQPQIHVSSAMWDRASHRDKAAIGILAHEIAHLYFSDLRALVWLDFSARMIRSILMLCLGCIVVVAAASLVPIAIDLHSGGSVAENAYKVLAALAASLLFSLIPIVGYFATRRQAGLITALIEVRADACGGLWTGGMDGFAMALRTDRGLKPTSLSDLKHSMFSVELSHLTAAERIKLLSDSSLLATPKLRYVFLTLLLAFIFPLNPLTPLIGGGMLDYWFMAGIVMGTHAAIIAMVIISAAFLPSPLRWHYCAVAALALMAITVLPRVNAYEFGYVLTDWVYGLVVPGGFGKEPLTASVMLSGLSTSIAGFWQQILTSSGGPMFAVAVAVSAISLRLLSVLGRRGLASPASFAAAFWTTPAIVAAFVAAIAVQDEWRFSDNAWAEWLSRAPAWLRLCSAELAALAAAAIESTLLLLAQK
jgi:hypothetical protein